ncbi:MAG TPA: methionyl-tRNA formyltransferase [Ignavibacteria bacterium]|nr:methionyl-tRNA formyltransferase [Ignavibacteria bacterium]
MKIIFMGTPGFAVPSLKILLDNKYDVQAVVTVPDKKKGRGLKTSFSEVKNFALAKNLKILQPDSLKDENFIKEIKTFSPGLIIVVAFRILPEEVFTIPEFGSINLHGSLLPKYRGAAPVNRAIMNGDTETGVTTFFLKNKVDTGNIILQSKIKIEPDDNAGIIHDKLSVVGADLVLKTVRLIEKGNVIEFSQDDSLASPAPKIHREDCKIDWDKGSSEIHNFIRGLSPYPAAFTLMDNKIVKIYSSSVTDLKSDHEPGSVIIGNKKIFVCTKDKLIEIHELQLEGKKKINAVDFINGLGKIDS